MEDDTIFMTPKEFVTNFNVAKPDWSAVPEEFPNCDLAELTSEEIGKFNAIKSLWFLAHPKTIKQSSRVWSDPEGYRRRRQALPSVWRTRCGWAYVTQNGRATLYQLP